MNMEEENKQISFAANFYQNEQIEQAKATLINGLNVYPNNNLIQDLLQQCQEMIDLNIQRQNKKIKENKHYSKTELVQKTNNNNFTQDIIQVKQKKGNDNEIEQKLNSIAKNSFQMRLKVLIMELKVVETFLDKKLMENENEKTHYIKSCIDIVNTALDVNDYKKVEEELFKAEMLSTELMRKIKKLVKKKIVKKEEVNKPEDDIQVPDYRSIVTVRGDNEDVINCIKKAKTALDNHNYDSAERLLLKAERIRPTKNARDLLKQVRAAMEIKENSGTIERAIESAVHVNIVEKETLRSEVDSINAVKCLTAFENAFSSGNFAKAERMLNKAKRLDPILDVEEKLSEVNALKSEKIVEKISEEVNKSKTQCKTADECLYRAIKAYSAEDCVNAEQFLIEAKTFDPILNLEPELSMIKTKTTSEIRKKNKNIEETRLQKTGIDSYVNKAAEYLYNAKKAYDAGDFIKAEQNFNMAKWFDSFLDLKVCLSKCKAEIALSTLADRNTTFLEKPPHAVQCKSVRDKEREKPNTKPLPKKEQEKKEKAYTRPVPKKEEEKKEIPNTKPLPKKEQEKIEQTNTKPQPQKKQQITEKPNTNPIPKKEQEKKEKPNTKPLPKKEQKENPHSKPLPKKEQVQKMIIMAKKEIDTKKLDAMNLLNTAEELYPTEQAKQLQKHLNCYEPPVKIDKSGQPESLNCMQKAEAAFHEGGYDRAEQFLHKSLGNCDSECAKTLLETVRNAKAQNTLKNLTLKFESCNKHVNIKSLNDTTDKYRRSDVATNAIAEENLENRKRLLIDAIEIIPKENDRKQLKHIEDVGNSHHSSDGAIILETVKSDIDLKRERDVKMFSNMGVDAINRRMYYVARYYLTHALEILPNEETRKLLRDVEMKINVKKSRHSLSKKDSMFEASKLLDKAEKLILRDDLEQAESLLIVSWDLSKSNRTTIIHKQFLEARLALLRGEKDNERYRRNDENSKIILKCDNLVLSAIEKYKNNEFDEAQALLMRASKLCPSIRINQLLIEIKENKSPWSWLKKSCKDKLH